jgi:hypothetical protein
MKFSSPASVILSDLLSVETKTTEYRSRRGVSKAVHAETGAGERKLLDS